MLESLAKLINILAETDNMFNARHSRINVIKFISFANIKLLIKDYQVAKS